MDCLVAMISQPDKFDKGRWPWISRSNDGNGRFYARIFGALTAQGRHYSNLIEGSLELEKAADEAQLAYLRASMDRQSAGLVKMALQ